MAKRARVIPGFSLSLGFTVFYLSLVVLLPLSALFFKSAALGWGDFWKLITSEWAMGATRFTLFASLIAAGINLVVGLLIAWVLARYEFPGRRFMDAVIDLPFALPTAVAGIALTALYAENGWIGGALKQIGFSYPWPEWRGFSGEGFPIAFRMYSKIALAPLGVVLALAFVGLPFIVRTVQPVIEDMSRDVEEAAASLGATRWQTFRRVILPQLVPALLTGFALSFSRGLGEYGSVVFISGRIPQTETTSELIVNLIETSNPWDKNPMAPATAVAVLLLVISFACLLVINLLQRTMARRLAAI